MKNILLLGSGLSTSYLVEYLLKFCDQFNWTLNAADINEASAIERLKNHPKGKSHKLNISDTSKTGELIEKADVVISMLPAKMHFSVAKFCLELKKSLLTASYVTEELKSLEKEFSNKGLSLFCELGLDPGLDHMSAMKVINSIRSKGGKMTAFESFTGGLLAPSNEDNPWEYKFTWNPRNVVLAGQGVVKFIQEGRYKFIPYHKVFKRTEIVHIPDHGYFEGYANRDSLKYREVYGLEDVKTIYRGTFRRPGFCKSWDVFIQLGATDDSYEMEGVSEMTHRQFINSFLSYNPTDSVELKLAHYMNLEIDSDIMYRLKWLELFTEDRIGLEKGTPAQILEHILRKKWSINEKDKDQIVMWHKFNYELDGEHKEVQSHLVVTGVSKEKTAMAKTVGLPIAIATKLFLRDGLGQSGLNLPVQSEIYEPILNELQAFDIKFEEREIEIK
ncbi:MAG: saccharopine dehydrogenase C-terminal domain-containing protein [Bacteroidota bacterium]